MNPGLPNISLQRTAPCGLAAELGSFGRTRTAILLITGLGLAFLSGCGSTGNAPHTEPVAENQSPLRVGGDVLPPTLIDKPEPLYPEAARRDGVQGDVIFEVIVSAKGTIADIMVLKSPDPRLEAAAEEAVRRWRYKPATKNGKPVSIYYTSTVKFRLP